MSKKRLLLITSKYPYSKKESDGGMTTVASIIESIKESYRLDLLFVRKYSEEERSIEGVENIFFEEIKHYSENKYERRINNYQQVSKRILKLESDYDFIIIVHASKAFGLEKAPPRVLKKIILYPMFLSYAYRESGEDVPAVYDVLEEKIIKSIKWFVCPSNFDKDEIIKHYGVNEDSLFVIPRSVSCFIKHEPRKARKGYRLLCIGNIKERKQPLAMLKIFERVKQKINAVKLVFAGEIQNHSLYLECLTFIKDNGLENSVSFVGTVSQKQIAKLIEDSDINVCTSNLETFGRCVFEGMYGGLPTVVFNELTCVHEFVKHNKGVIFVANPDEFGDEVISLLTDEIKYIKQSSCAIESTQFISFESEKKMLINCLHKIGRQI